MEFEMIDQKNKIRTNKAKKRGAEKKSAPNRNNNSYSLEDEIIIGIPKTKQNSKTYPYSKSKNYSKIKKKKVKKISQKQIKRRKAILKIIKWTCILGFILGVLLYIIMSPIFAVKQITVITNGKLDSQEIISLAGINLNENTFRYTKQQIINNIKENAYVDEVIIKRKLPNEVQIIIKERTPILMLTYGNSYVYLNSQGYMLEISSEYQELPILKGIETKEEEIEIGKRLCNNDLQRLTTVLKILELSQNEEMLNLITAIDISDKNNYKIIMDKEEKVVYLGDCSILEERMIWVKTIIKKEKDTPGEIFVNMNLNSERPFFRERV